MWGDKMEEKIMDMLEQLYVGVKGIQSELSSTNKRLDNMEGDIKALKKGQDHTEIDIKALKQGQERTEIDIKTIKQGQERIENKLDNMEALNANRHVEINGKLNELSTSLTVVEAVAGKNMTDIANIKLVK